MSEFTIEIAGTAALVRCTFESTREYCRRYWTDRAPECSIEILPEDRAYEQELLNREADAEGLRRRKFTEPFLERTAIQRRMASFVLGKNVLLLHGSTIAADGTAFLFTAKTGVGKSTHTRLWRELLGERAVMVNDDRPFLTVGSEGVIAHGAPWSGKHGLDTNISVPLGGICILQRGTENRIWRISAEEALPELLDQAFLPEESQRSAVIRLTEQLAGQVSLWRMTCTRDPDAARIAFSAMSGAQKP